MSAEKITAESTENQEAHEPPFIKVCATDTAIEVAGKLIYSCYDVEMTDLAKTLSRSFGTGETSYHQSFFDVSELKQIAEHLLVYVSAHREDGE